MKKYIAKVCEHSYEDDYQAGEVDGTYSIFELEAKHCSTVEEAVKWFKKSYGGEGEFKPELIDDCHICIGMPLQVETDSGWRDATVEQIDEWKQGKRSLWNVEHMLHISEVRLLEGDELKRAVEPLGVVAG